MLVLLLATQLLLLLRLVHGGMAGCLVGHLLLHLASVGTIRREGGRVAVRGLGHGGGVTAGRGLLVRVQLRGSFGAA